MASGGKRGSAGERVLEGRHVIGLFMLMLLFSGVFFTLGYVMGRNQYDGQVRASTNLRSFPDSAVFQSPKLRRSLRTKSRPPNPSPNRRRQQIPIGSFTTRAIRIRPTII